MSFQVREILWFLCGKPICHKRYLLHACCCCFGKLFVLLTYVDKAAMEIHLGDKAETAADIQSRLILKRNSLAAQSCKYRLLQKTMSYKPPKAILKL